MNPLPLILLSFLLATPQDRVHLQGGSILSGTVESEDELGILLRTSDDRLQFLSREDVSRVEKISAEKGSPQFIRFFEGKEKGDALQSAVGVYLHEESGQIVSLVGAVHVGDVEYYSALQDLLDDHELVLFEGVGGKKGEPIEIDPEALKKFGSITRMQLQMGKMLDLAFQKDEIDYSRPHFKNADMDLNEVEEELEKRDQTLLPMQGLLKYVAPPPTSAESAEEEEEDVLAKTGHRKRVSAEMKRSFGRVLGNSTQLFSQMGIYDKNNRDDVIISLRNDAALKILESSLSGGAKSIAVFYGAAHLEDLDRILINEMGFSRQAHRWMDAWAIPPSPLYKKRNRN